MSLPQSNPSGSISFSTSPTDPTAQPDLPSAGGSSTANPQGKRGSISEINPSSVHPAAQQTDVINPATEADPLNQHHRPSLSAESSGVQGLAGDTMIRRTSLSQNAPGKAGDVGEKVLGGIGFGGAEVERPEEDQGIGEKIAAFLGT